MGIQGKKALDPEGDRGTEQVCSLQDMQPAEHWGHARSGRQGLGVAVG